MRISPFPLIISRIGEKSRFTITRIKMLVRRQRGKSKQDALDETETETRKESEMEIIKIIQKEVLKEDILSLRNGSYVNKNSP